MRESPVPSACAWLYECPPPRKPKAHRVSHRLFPPLGHPYAPSLSTLLKVCPLVPVLFSFAAIVVCVAKNDVADVPQSANIFRSRTPIRCLKVVSNRSSSHLYTYNRVGDVSNEVLTHIRRVRRCQKKPPNLPRFAYVPQFVARSVPCLKTARVVCCRRLKRPRSPPPKAKRAPDLNGLCPPICSSLKIGERGSRLRTLMPVSVRALHSLEIRFDLFVLITKNTFLNHV